MPLAARTNRGSTFTKRNKMNSKKFLDQLGLIALISKIKQALNGKQNVDMVVTIAQSGNAYSCDTSIADIVAAHDAGRDVYAVLPPVSDGSSTKIKLVDVQNYGSGTVMMVSFGDIINNGINNVLYSVSGTRQNNLDAWSVSQKTMQEKLVSGTNIKTVSGVNLLGSGDLQLNGEHIIYYGVKPKYSDFPIDDCIDDLDTRVEAIKEPLVVTYGDTTSGLHTSILAAANAGRPVFMKLSDWAQATYLMNDTDSSQLIFTYTDSDIVQRFYLSYANNTEVWSMDEYYLQSLISSGNKVDADFVEYRGADTSRLGNGDSMTEALQTLDAAITNLGTPNEIASITTQESSASGGNNVVTITDTDGTSTSFNVKNGKDGKDGADGADGVSLGEIALVQTTGDATDEVMSQKAVSDRIKRLTTEDLEQSIAVKRLPEGYEMLDYIINGTATGSCAAIDTGLVPNDTNWRFVGSWARSGNIGNYGRIIESNYTDATYCYKLCANGTSVANIYANAYSRGNSGTVVPLSDSSVDVWHTYDLSHGKLVLDGVENEISTIAGSVPPPTTLKIGHVNYPQKTKVFQAYHNGELVAYMVPCKYGSDVGMYDLVREQFYTSSNAHSFSAGTVIVEPADRLLDGEHLAGMIEQQTGDNDFKLMSQQSITNNIQRLDIDTLYSTTSQLKKLLTAKGWMIGRIFTNTGYFTDNANYCISPLIPFQDMRGVSITIDRGGTLNTYPFTTYAENGKTRKYSYNTALRVIATSNTDASYDTAFYIRLCFNLENLRSCYMLNNDTGEYIIKMDDYIKELLDENSYLLDHKALERLTTQEAGNNRALLMSQYGDMVSNYTTKKPTYIQGRLCYYRLADYPQLDPRTADGISIAFACDNSGNKRCVIFDINDPTASVNNGFAVEHFGLWWWDGSISFGLLRSYSSTMTGGYRFSRVRGHYVLTYDFKTGECKCYRNGVLYSTQTPASWDEQTMIRDYFDGCTHICLNSFAHTDTYKMNGIAVFGSVLTDEDVVDLYGSGNESIRETLIEAKWQANNLNPLYPSVQLPFGSNNTINNFDKTQEADGSFTITAKASATSLTWLEFGFNGITGVINNATLDWDFEIVSGSIKYNGGSYDRTYHGNATGNSYAKGVYVIYDSNGNDVTTSDLGIGMYHVTAKPNHVAIGSYDTYDLHNFYVFTGCSEDIVINVKAKVKVTERGAALECSITNYAGAYWKLANGIQLPFNDTTHIYGTNKRYIGTDTYIPDTVIYNSSEPPQFNGQIAVDTTNGKVYIGYLTGTGGTWKQVSN